MDDSRDRLDQIKTSQAHYARGVPVFTEVARVDLHEHEIAARVCDVRTDVYPATPGLRSVPPTGDAGAYVSAYAFVDVGAYAYRR